MRGQFSLEQLSEFRSVETTTPQNSILRPAHLNSLAPLGQKNVILLAML
ncbi:hypothetical protein D3875_01405 [Deinococcus cavernae]|uniref:Uncharacterized protein n=1 Tax=Deinococcus cavernae TaxID=2320857 RepID=A0A418VGH3_9DEIO|nr:hypothetical protein D3875_01405 [Deinococcus cavernae]